MMALLTAALLCVGVFFQLSAAPRTILSCYSCSSGDTGVNVNWLLGTLPPPSATCPSPSPATNAVSCTSFCVSDYVVISIPWTGMTKTIFVRDCADNLIIGGKNPTQTNCCKSAFFNQGGIYYTTKGCTCNSNNCNTLSQNGISTEECLDTVTCPEPCATNPCPAGQTCTSASNGIGYLCNGNPPGSTTPRPTTTAAPTTTMRTTPKKTMTSPLPPQTTTPSTNAWQRVANMFANSINESVDPCQDFYQFSCGKWIANHPIPPDQSSTISFGIVNTGIIQSLNASLRLPTNGTQPWPRAIQQAKLLFQKCLNVNSGNYNGSRVLKIMNGYGSWPLLNPNWNPASSYAAPLFMGKLNSVFGVNTLVSAYVSLDYRHNYRHMVTLDQASLTYPAIYYNTPSTAKNLRQLLTYLMNSVAMEMASVAGTPAPAQLASDVTDMVNLEFLIANISIPSSQQRNASAQYNIFDVNSASARWPNLGLGSFFSGFLQSLSSSNASQVTQRFIITFPSFFDRLNTVIQPGSARLLQNYLMWRLIHPYAQFLPSTRPFYKEFKKGMEHVDALQESAVDCVNMVNNYIPFATGRVYIETHFNRLPSKPRDKLNEMIMSVLGAFRQMVSQLAWMDIGSKITAVNKVNGIAKNVAYPDWIMDNTRLNAEYFTLNLMSTDTFWDIMQKLTAFQNQQQFNLLYAPTNRHDFGGASPAIVNAWYQPQYNSITFPAGILNPPFFEADFPSSVNYGGMGVVMGHELTHGFDDQGVQWNGNGTLQTWMNPASQSGFKNMAQCIINEYNGFCFPSLPAPNCVSGVRTQGENIADNGGIKAAYIAFKSNEILNGVDPPLPGSMGKYTPDQLFFMAFGQVWCRNIKTSALPQQLLLDPHAPARDRVWGTVQNFPVFGQAFNCPAGSPMAPTNHCNIW